VRGDVGDSGSGRMQASRQTRLERLDRLSILLGHRPLSSRTNIRFGGSMRWSASVPVVLLLDHPSISSLLVM